MARADQKGTREDGSFNPPGLEVFDNQFPDREYTHEIITDEYSSMCPKTGMPDYGTIIVRYAPWYLCVELKSYKLYLHAFRDAGIFYEVLVNRILDDFFEACSPRWVEVEVRMTPRGGIRSVLRARRNRPVLRARRNKEGVEVLDALPKGEVKPL